MLMHKLQHRLEQHHLQNLTRKRYLIEHREKNKIIIAGQTLIDFSHNDYLGLANDPKIKATFKKALIHNGVGSGASALISGYYKEHQQLEEQLAEFLNRDRALLFNSGYQANIGTITALANRETTIVADKLCHASLIDGIVLSRAHHHRYHHNDLSQAERLIQQAKFPCLVITDSVNSMEGDICNLPTLANISKENNALLLVDDAHGVGYLGGRGAGICDHFQLTQIDVPYLITPFGKALGSMGAVVTGSHQHIEILIQFARSYRYTTALSPALCQATLTALQIMKSENWRRDKLHHLIQFFLKGCRQRNLTVIGDERTPIKSLICGSNETTMHIQESLIEKGMYVSCIRPPTVTKNTARIRISINCFHDEKQINYLLDNLTDAYETLTKK